MTNIACIMRGRLRLSRQMLESLYANTPEKDFNLVVLSDCEDDFRVTKLLRSYLERKNFALLEAHNTGHILGQLKNTAVGYSSQRFGRGDWLCIPDGDVCFMPGWLDTIQSMALASEPKGFRLWGGQIHPFHHAIPPEGGGVYLCGSVFGTDGIRDYSWTEHAILDGPCWFLRWKTWQEIGGFSRKHAPGPCQSDEYPWVERLRAVGGRIGVAYPHCVIHCGLTHGDGTDCVGRKEREAMIPAGVIAE